jgi:hypothetical protein
MTTTIKTGDVFASSWGYNQTNVVFYQVVDLTPSGKSARVRKVAQDVVSEGDGWEMVAPLMDDFVSDTFTKRIGENLAGRDPYLRITSFEYAFPWSGEPKHQTGPYAGH